MPKAISTQQELTAAAASTGRKKWRYVNTSGGGAAVAEVLNTHQARAGEAVVAHAEDNFFHVWIFSEQERSRQNQQAASPAGGKSWHYSNTLPDGAAVADVLNRSPLKLAGEAMMADAGNGQIHLWFFA